MSNNTTLLSTAQLLELLESIYGNIESRSTTVSPNGFILIWDTVANKFYQTKVSNLISGGTSVEVINNLTSTAIDKALSALQGKILNDSKLSNTPTADELTKYFDTDPTLNSNKFLTSDSIKKAIDNAVVALFKFIGNAKSVNKILYYDLNNTPIKEAIRTTGYVYNAIEDGIVFVNGIDDTKGELKFLKGDNIVWTDDGWDSMTSFIDMNLYATKIYVDDKIGYIGQQLDIINNEVI